MPVLLIVSDANFQSRGIGDDFSVSSSPIQMNEDGIHILRLFRIGYISKWLEHMEIKLFLLGIKRLIICS